MHYPQQPPVGDLFLRQWDRFMPSGGDPSHERAPEVPLQNLSGTNRQQNVWILPP